MLTQFNINQQLSIYIPYINSKQANTEYIVNIFHRLNIGYVKHIEFQYITSEDGSYYSTVIFMKYWYNNKMVERLQDKIINNDDGARIVYDDPQYWIIYPTKNKQLQSDYLLKMEQTYSDKFSEMEQKFSEMEQKFSEMEKTLAETQWWVKLHDANIKFICDQIRNEKTVIDLDSDLDSDCDEVKLESNNENIIIVDNSYINNSCCGAVTDAWKPSCEQIWSKRLRKRK